jgi:2-iminobutanoate/2-iminopropanoate deaminase
MKNIGDKPPVPEAVGPYSMFTEYNGLLFLSGQVAIDPATGEAVRGSIALQTRQCLTNIKAVLESAGSSMDKVLKCNVHMTSLDYFDEMNREYKKFFPGKYPARITFEVNRLFDGLDIEIDVIAHK